MMEREEVYGNFLGNRSCEEFYIPTAAEHLESLGAFGIGILSAGVVLAILTLYFAVDACCNVYRQKESIHYKSNVIMILALYPIISFFCLTATGVPRTQILSETSNQIFLMIVLYRVYLVVIDVGRRKATKTPSMVLKSRPCCCLPFPPAEMTETNLSRLGLLVLQLPIVQGIVNCSYLFMSIEEPGSQEHYRLYIESVSFVSIVLGIYAINVTVASLQEDAPDAKLRGKAAVSQLVVLFSKLQTSVIRNVARTGLFPCNPPISPEIYASVTCNALMLIEMLLLCYVARHFYYVEGEENVGLQPTDRTRDNVEAGDLTNNNEAKRTSPA